MEICSLQCSVRTSGALDRAMMWFLFSINTKSKKIFIFLGSLYRLHDLSALLRTLLLTLNEIAIKMSLFSTYYNFYPENIITLFLKLCYFILAKSCCDFFLKILRQVRVVPSSSCLILYTAIIYTISELYYY